MAISVTKPTVGGSEDTWGATINTGLDTIVAAVNTNEAAIAANEAAIAAVVTFPAGGIVMWSGSVASIPSGWNLCDGANSTPDLRNRFVIGAGSNYSVDATGGATTDSITTSSSGGHSHSVSVSSTSLSVARDGWGTAGGPIGNAASGHLIVGSGVTEGSETLESIRIAGSNQSLGSHSHSASSGAVGDHNHTATVDTVPPYYALAYIMKA